MSEARLRRLCRSKKSTETVREPKAPNLLVGVAPSREASVGIVWSNADGRHRTQNIYNMPSIHRCELPHGALLEKYQSRGAYADCYVTEIARHVSHAEYVQAFYTTPLFKVERLLLAWLVSKPSTDAQASQLASGTLDSFAAWSVEERCEDQLLMCDFQGRTRSWLMVVPAEGESAASTRLYFGSAVAPARAARAGAPTPGLGLTFRLLLGFHKLYSRALLFSAKSRLMRQRPEQR